MRRKRSGWIGERPGAAGPCTGGRVEVGASMQIVAGFSGSELMADS